MRPFIMVVNFKSKTAVLANRVKYMRLSIPSSQSRAKQRRALQRLAELNRVE